MAYRSKPVIAIPKKIVISCAEPDAAADTPTRALQAAADILASQQAAHEAEIQTIKGKLDEFGAKHEALASRLPPVETGISEVWRTAAANIATMETHFRRWEKSARSELDTQAAALRAAQEEAIAAGAAITAKAEEIIEAKARDAVEGALGQRIEGFVETGLWLQEHRPYLSQAGIESLQDVRVKLATAAKRRDFLKKLKNIEGFADQVSYEDLTKHAMNLEPSR
ncbi:hypothetical protein [Poseidonocella sp. HB161398]|uniref:hypothetical protein n=1 Tax=Poseidonocella sp. HB161398 TaxID=2320855 RepID=UPI001108E300|nr:hypothetical protein [Poseidonocella sp. HB161398]